MAAMSRGGHPSGAPGLGSRATQRRRAVRQRALAALKNAAEINRSCAKQCDMSTIETVYACIRELAAQQAVTTEWIAVIRILQNLKHLSYNIVVQAIESWQELGVFCLHIDGAMVKLAVPSAHGMDVMEESESCASSEEMGEPCKSSSQRVLNQSSRYADLERNEAELIKKGAHVLVAYVMKPKWQRLWPQRAGHDYLATAAHCAAKSSTGTNVNACTTDEYTQSVDALVYYINPDEEEMKIAYPIMLFDRLRSMLCSVLTRIIGNNRGMDDVEYGIYDIYVPPMYLRLPDGPSCSVVDIWRILDCGTSNGVLAVGTKAEPYGEACHALWMGGDFIKDDEPQGHQIFFMNECIPEVAKAMRACIKNC
mmetsp:Transcript_65231/g.125951  ORF Transcript_65231/g.125951 Transcript_65231/m.125951 type:complete len:367 (+) Transcript_65231:133-1233(+)